MLSSSLVNIFFFVYFSFKSGNLQTLKVPLEQSCVEFMHDSIS